MFARPDVERLASSPHERGWLIVWPQADGQRHILAIRAFAKRRARKAPRSNRLHRGPERRAFRHPLERIGIEQSQHLAFGRLPNRPPPPRCLRMRQPSRCVKSSSRNHAPIRSVAHRRDRDIASRLSADVRSRPPWLVLRPPLIHKTCGPSGRNLRLDPLRRIVSRAIAFAGRRAIA